MKDILLIGVDVGTQGTKAALYDTDGRRLAECFEPSRLITTYNREVYEDAERIYLSVLRTIKGLFASSAHEPNEVACIGVDAQMAGIVGVEGDFRALTGYDSWLDTRCESAMPRMREYEDEIISKTGGQVTYAHGAKMLWWKHEVPEVYRSIVKFMPLSSYITARLCGISAGEAFIDPTHLHFSGFADNAAKRWDEGLISALGFDAEKLPEIIEADKIIGGLTRDAAKVCGLAAGTPVIAGCGDTAAASLGAGILRPGQAYDVAGTASVFAVATDGFVPDIKNKTLMCARSAIPGLYLSMAYISGGGLCLKWYADMQRRSLAELDEMAALVEAGCGGLTFIPHFSGRTCPLCGDASGALFGLTFSHDEGAVYRSIMEAVAYEYHSYLGALRSAGGMLPDEVICVGGGAKSPLFCKIKADVLGLDYLPLAGAETATLGVAMLAGSAIGALPSLEGILERSRERGSAIYHEPEATAGYRPFAEKYLKLLNSVCAMQASERKL